MIRIVSFSVLALVCGTSEAGSRHTTEAVTLRKKPGEKQAAVAQIAPNTEVTVLAEDGRWLRVRVNGVEGFTPRTTISDDPDAARPRTAGWSATRHPGDHEDTALQVATLAPGAMLDAPRSDARKVRELAKGAQLSVVDAATTPGWIRAHDDQGHDGWVARSLVENSTTAVVTTGVDLRGSGLAHDDFARAERPLAIRTELGFGYRSLGMDLSSNAEGGLTNYRVDADAIAIVAAADATWRDRRHLVVAGDARVELGNASPGIEYLGPTSPPGTIAFRTFGVDLGVRAGVRVKQAIDLAVRVGGHYDAFLTTSVDNAGMLPRERLLGATIGARIEIAPPHSRIGVSARFDWLALGSRAQTAGLEDGQDSTAHAAWGGLCVRYTLGWLAPFIALDVERATTSWTGMSARAPGVTEASRVDTTQLMEIGISAEL